MADNRFGVAHLVLTILGTTMVVGSGMYAVTSQLIMADVRQHTAQNTKELDKALSLELTKLESRVDFRIGNVSGALEKIEQTVKQLEREVITLQQQQIADIELRSMVGEVGIALHNLKTEISLLNDRTARLSDLADKVEELNSQVVLINEKVKKK